VLCPLVFPRHAAIPVQPGTIDMVTVGTTGGACPYGAFEMSGNISDVERPYGCCRLVS
jgi:hypothetical protein